MTRPLTTISALCSIAVLTVGVRPSAGEPAMPLDVPVMIEEAGEAGIDHSYTGPWEFFVGGGLAAFDCNGDRFPDLAIAGGSSPAKVYVNRSAAGGRLAFEEVEGAIPTVAETMVTGFYPLDIDNDGFKDLIALRVGENQVLRGGPDCSFEPANRAFAIDGGRAWTTSFSATFENGATFPTLAFGNYVDRTAPGTPWGTCDDNWLMRPRAEDGAQLRRPGTAHARLLRALPPVHRLEPLGHALPSHHQ